MAPRATEGSIALKLPIEIWRMVIVSAVESLEPMDNYHEASESLDTRFHLARRVTSKSPEYTLMLVCKMLNAIATEFFYERISVQTKKQLIALAQGLKSPRIANNMAKWTRRFDLHYAANTTVYNSRDKGSMVRVLRSCPNLTHLVIEIAIHEYYVGAKARDTTTIMDTCAKSCKRLEVLHLAFNLSTYKWANMTPGAFFKSFRNIKILRLGQNAKIAIPSKTEVHLGELPFLHTFEACEEVHFLLLTDVRLPLLSTVHFRNNCPPYLCYPSSPLLRFISAHGNKLTTLTLIGVVHPRPDIAKGVVPLLLKCTKLQVFVMDLCDLVRLLPIDELFLPRLTRLELTTYLRTGLSSRSDFWTTIHGKLRARFPSLTVLHWLGRVDPDVPSANTREGLEPSEGGTDAHHANAAGIRIENRDGEKLELHQLLVR